MLSALCTSSHSKQARISEQEEMFRKEREEMQAKQKEAEALCRSVEARSKQDTESTNIQIASLNRLTL